MSRDIVCAILAAGRASRLGMPKATLPFEGTTFLERAIAAACGYRTVVVAGPGDRSIEDIAVRHGVLVIANDEPERGMTHSLRLADRTLGAPEASLAVLLVDTPFVDADAVARVAAASERADIAFPCDPAGKAGHPVFFGPVPRRELARLSDGDTLRTLRDDPRFTRVAVPFEDDRPFIDVDTADDLRRLRERLSLKFGRHDEPHVLSMTRLPGR